MFRFRLVMQILVLGSLSLFPFWAGSARPETPYPRVAAYELDATFFPARGMVSATARVRFAPDAVFGDRLVFHLHDELAVESLRVDGISVNFRQETVAFYYNYSTQANRVTVELGRPVTDEVLIAYSGKLSPSSARSPSDYMRIDGDGVLLRAYCYSLWFPIFLPDRGEGYAVDFPRVTLAVPAEMRALFTGDQVGDRIIASDAGDRRISEWRARGVSLNDAQCTARRFGVLAEGPHRIYHERDPASAATGGKVLDLVADLVTAFARDYGEPSGGIGVHVMQMPEFGDIASGNVIGVAGDNWSKFETSVWGQRTVAHELVHAFVRPYVRKDDPLYALVVEGFPSYFHLPILGAMIGPDVCAGWMRETEAAYLERRETGRDGRGDPLPPEKPLLDLTADDISEYKDTFVLNDRARLFFDWIRRSLGVDGFRTFTRDLFDRESLDVVAFEELILRHLGEAARSDLHTWLRTSDYPPGLHLTRRGGNEG